MANTVRSIVYTKGFSSKSSKYLTKDLAEWFTKLRYRRSKHRKISLEGVEAQALPTPCAPSSKFTRCLPLRRPLRPHGRVRIACPQALYFVLYSQAKQNVKPARGTWTNQNTNGWGWEKTFFVPASRSLLRSKRASLPRSKKNNS